MNITLILPFLLFFLAVIINLILINYKLNKFNQNTSAQKRILDKIRKAEQALNENIVLTEERISAQKNEVNNIGRNIDKKVQELTSHSEELANLSNTLNEYRSMLAMLEVSTNKTHEWVVTVRNDCSRLEQLQKVIEEHQKATLDIINSYGDAVEKQNDFYGKYESKLEKIKRNYITELDDYVKVTEENLNSKIISIGQVSDETVEAIENAKKSFTAVSSEHMVFAKQSKEILDTYKSERDSALKKVKEELDTNIKIALSDHQINISESNEKYKQQYSKEIDALNYNKKEEVDEALNKLIQSIHYLDKNRNSKKTNNSSLNKEQSQNDTKDLEYSEKTSDNNKDNKESKSKNKSKSKEKTIKPSDTDQKVFVAVGEEEEISLD